MMKKWLCVSLVFICAAALQAGVRSQLRQGGKLYQDQKYGSALQTYGEILKENPADQRALFNAGNAYYRLHEYTQAEEAYQQAADLSGDYGQSALYNLGNAYYRAGNKEKAIEAYQQAILKNPQDKEAIHNLQLVLQQEQDKNDNQNNEDNSSDQSDNQNPQDQDNKGSAPQQPQPQNQPQSGQLSQSDADRVMSMVREQEYTHGTPADRAPERTVEKDW